MSHHRSRRAAQLSRLFSLSIPLVLAGPVWGAADTRTPADGAGQPMLEEVIVVGDASLEERLGSVGSFGVLGAGEIDRIGATHINETLARVPGVWVARGSGQEHLTAIRSPVFTGTGACGEFMYLEDGIPIRPAGFCNINNLFEVNTEMAGAIEVWRGPASAVLGGNALHGAVNVLTAMPEGGRLTLEGGPYDFYRVGARVVTGSTADRNRFGASLNSTSTNGWRDDTGYSQQKVSAVHLADVSGWSVKNTLNYSLLNQETGGYVYGFEAYEDGDLRRTNPNPEAYRDAWSLRLASHWRRGPWSVTPYLRRSDMEFLQHFLPGQPKESNDQTSGGLMLGYDLTDGDLNVALGAQLEYMDASLVEDQAEPLTDSSAFNNAVRPQGLHYDFDVEGQLVAGYLDLEWTFADVWTLLYSIRAEWQAYDYDNRMLTGNTREDGTACGFGGCLYNRPADRDDEFFNSSGRLGLKRQFDAWGYGYAVVATGFRAPQATELYRLQRGQDVADLQSEEVVSAELGFKAPRWSLAAFVERTDHFIFRDAAGLNVSNGETESEGVELSAYQGFGNHVFELSLSYAEHRYAFSGGASGGEVIEDGNFVDTAPRWLGNARWRWVPDERLESELEVNYVGEHYIDAANSAEYDGHVVVNWRGQYALNDRAAVFARVINVLDERYADRADYTVFNPDRYRYFPAMPRQLYVGVNLNF